MAAELQQQMLETQYFCKSISSAAAPTAASAAGSGDSSSSNGAALQEQQRQQLSGHLQRFEASLAELQLEERQKLWLQVRGCCLGDTAGSYHP